MLYCEKREKELTERMEWFCTEEELGGLKRRERGLTLAFRILTAVSAAVFVALCLMIRTENAGVMHGVLMAVTAVLGWTCILLYQIGIRESRTQLGHLKMLRDGEKVIREGKITLTRESIQIPKSIRIRKVLLDTGGAEPERLNLDEKWVSRLPPDGSRVRLALAHSYIAGVEVVERAEEGKRQAPVGAGKARTVTRLLPLLGLWALAAVFFSSFVFYRITDTDPAHKITIFVDGEVTGEAELAARLERGLGEPIRMVQIHPFRYALFGSDTLKTADLYIVPDSERTLYADWFAPGEEGRAVFDPETGRSVAGAYIQYLPEGGSAEPWRLYIGAGSPHLEDGLARRAAELLLAME